MRGQGMSGQGMRGPGSPYEVRCLRCDVSFPVETRRCIHCGGATSASGAGGAVGAYAGTAESIAGGAPGTHPPAPIGIGERDELEAPEAPRPQGVAASLLRSFGSLFWIIALVGFSLARSCSEG